MTPLLLTSCLLVGFSTSISIPISLEGRFSIVPRKFLSKLPKLR